MRKNDIRTDVILSLSKGDVRSKNPVETAGVSTYSISIVFTLLLFLNFGNIFAANWKAELTETEINQLLNYASKTLVKKCDSSLARFNGDPDSVAYSEMEKIEIKDFKKLIVNNRKLSTFIIGCGGSGELILIDSMKEDVKIVRKQMSIPGKHAVLGELLDLNDDSISELTINFSAGAHGYYSSFVSLYQDSLSFLPIENNQTRFFAFSGGIQVLDLDNDGIMEVKIGPDLSRPDSTQFEIYKWTGREYSKMRSK